MSVVFSLLWVLVRETILLRGDLWEKDLSSAMKIGLSLTGYKSVDLRCDSQHFDVNVTLNEDFEGVVYTRGSFNDKSPACFKRHHENRFRKDGRLVIRLRIPFHKCGTVMDVSESRYTNTLLIQHEPDLIMPGDAAFSLECAFEPEIKLATAVGVTKSPFRSKITLVDADPSAENASSVEENMVALSETEKVSFVPDTGRNNDEL